MNDREIIEALATKVMGFGPVRCRLLSCGCDELQHWIDSSNVTVARDWNPLLDPAASKEVREKLAERFDQCRLEREVSFKNRATLDDETLSRAFSFCVWNLSMQDGEESWTDVFDAEADTEERAVALCALKSVGIEVTP